jgi:hypothetical protein
VLAVAPGILLSGCQSKNHTSQITHDQTQEQTENGEDNSDVQKEAPREALPWNRAVSVMTARQRLRDKYNLQPDRRFIQAAGIIAKLLPGNGGSTKVSLLKEKWHISVDGHEIGAVAEFADFQQHFALLSVFARTLVSKNKISLPPTGMHDDNTKKLLDLGTPAKLLEAISQTEQDWQRREASARQLSATCSALSLLAWEMEDELDIGDPIIAKALAFSAISAAMGNDTDEDAAILAHRMKYYANAKTFSQKLPAGSFFRLYQEQKKKELIQASTQQPGNFKISFCLLSLLADQLLETEWKVHAATITKSNPGSAIPLLKTFLAFNDDQSTLPAAHNLLNAVLIESKANGQTSAPINLSNLQLSYADFSRSANWQIKNLLDDFENSLSKPQTTVENSLDIEPAKESLNKCFYRSAFYSGVNLIANAYLRLPYAEESTKEFLKSLKTEKEGGANELIALVSDEIGNTRRSFSEISGDATNFAVLGPRARATVFKSLGTFYENPHPELLLQGGSSLFRVMDDRPGNRLLLSQIALKSLMDLSLQHRLFIASNSAGVPLNLSERFNGLIESRNFKDVFHIVNDQSLPHFMRYRLVEFLRANEVGSGNTLLLDAIYQKLSNEDPHDFKIADSYYQYLITRKKYAQSREQMKRWLAQQTSYQFLDEAKAQTNMARASFELGHYKDALSDLGKAATSGYEEAFAAKIAILQALGRSEAAQQWSEEFLKRHPADLVALNLNCQCLWKQNKYDRCAELLRAHKNELNAHFWRHSIGTSLVNLFSKEPENLQRAIASLKKCGFVSGASIGQIANQFYARDLPEEAFQIIVSAQPNPEEVADVATSAYRYLKRWRGKSFALAWLEKEVPMQERSSLAPFAFLTGQYELLGNFIPLQGTGSTATDINADVNLMRAAAYAISPDALSASEKELLAKAFTNKTAIASTGNYLLGRDKTIEQLELGPIERCAVSFYVGWKWLATAKNFYEGCEWLRLSLDDNEASMNQYHWSQAWLSDIDLTLMQYPVLTNDTTTRFLRIKAPSEQGTWNDQRRFGLRFTDIPAKSR